MKGDMDHIRECNVLRQNLLKVQNVNRGLRMREALKYFENSKAILSSAPIEDNTYTDIKYVREACGACLSGSA